MQIEYRFILFQCMIIIPFLLGIWIKRRMAYAEKYTKVLILINLTTMAPVISLWSIWGLSIQLDLIFLPLSGFLLVLIGMICGVIISFFMKLSQNSKTSFLISSSLANHGFTMGGFICYLLLGETGLGMANIFILYFVFYVFLIIFPFAMKMSHSAVQSARPLDLFINIRNMPLYASLLAIGFNLLHVQRPAIHLNIDIILLISMCLYYFTLGIHFQHNDLWGFIKENIAICIVKFCIVPLFAILLVSIFEIDHHIKRVIIIQSCMPAAIYSVITSILFDLDVRLSSSVFVINSLFFLFMVLPIVLFFNLI